MKKGFYVLICIVFLGSTLSNNLDAQNNVVDRSNKRVENAKSKVRAKHDKAKKTEQLDGIAAMKFENLVHDFGKLNESIGKATTVFTFKNEGKVPIIIIGSSASCGCTTPKYSDKPILPGEEGQITVTYSTIGRIGVFEKQIRVYTNLADEPLILVIKGDVLRDS